MACPVCGKPSPCAHELKRPAVLVGPEPGPPLRAALSLARDGVDEAYDQTAQRYPQQRPSASPAEEFLARASEPWRQEVVSRVQQHRARRRKRFDPNATMELDFQKSGSPSRAASDFARDGAEKSAESGESGEQSAPRSSAPLEPPKIIEFPRPRPPVQPFHFEPAPEVPSDLELAEPVLDSPRILDAPEPPPEQLNLLPTFADIQLDDTTEYRPGHQVELPPQAAPLTHRAFALLVDMMVVLLGSAIFAIALIMFGRGVPQSRLALLSALLVGGSLWLIYQYLFMIYAPATPGMQLADLELCTFQGEPVPLSLRRWRVLAGMLSACAVGLGFLWAFVDEDTLGWHDRITQTHVRRSSA